jgi:hypothetical protein
METLKIDLKTAVELNKEAPAWFKKVLNGTFGNRLSGNIMDCVKTFEDAYAEADNETRREFDRQMHHDLSDDTIARIKMVLIAKVLRGKWEPDFNNPNEKKWYPWFKFSAGSGFGFSNSDYNYDNTHTYVGSRLCFPTKEMSDYFGTQFIEIIRPSL